MPLNLKTELTFRTKAIDESTPNTEIVKPLDLKSMVTAQPIEQQLDQVKKPNKKRRPNKKCGWEWNSKPIQSVKEFFIDMMLESAPKEGQQTLLEKIQSEGSQENLEVDTDIYASSKQLIEDILKAETHSLIKKFQQSRNQSLPGLQLQG